ncbi:hypothetical protein Tco_0227936 [Tanacetum coccineum]
MEHGLCPAGDSHPKLEWEKYLKERNRPYKPFEDLEENEMNISDDHEWLIPFLYEAACAAVLFYIQHTVDGVITLGQTVSTNGGKSEEYEALAPTVDSSLKLLISAKLNDTLATQYIIIHNGNKKMSDGNNNVCPIQKLR